MMDAGVIQAQLGNVLEATSCEGVGRLVRGKVRDSYLLGDRRLLVVTDRISAFDCVLGTIPFKGQVLNQMAAFWFEVTRDLAPNHMLTTPDPNVMLVRECEQLPLEFVVRGYITGVTKTSAWAHYAQGGRLFCGHRLPEGLRKDQRLERPIVTPTTKHEHHDRNISREEAVAEGLIDGRTFDEAEALCLRLYARGVERAAERGLILVDTKYELGRIQEELVVSDEIHTPDSSRYWYQDSYEARFAAGDEPRKLDKEYVRQWLAARGFRGEGAPPALDDEVRVEAARRYIEAFETITGRTFQPDTRPIGPRVHDAIAAFRSPSPVQKAASMRGKRIFKRVQLIAALDVVHPDTGQPIGSVNDINAEGLGVRSRQPFAEGRMYALHVKLPVALHGVSVLEVSGVCAWCRPAGTPGLHDSGFIFAGILQDALEVIEELVRRYRR